MCSLLTLHFHYLTFSLSHTSTNTYICKHVAQLPTVIWEETSRFQAHENLCFWMIRGEADGSISEAAAARPTAPSGAENQDNFIVIISLPLSLLLQPRRRRKGNTREGELWRLFYIYGACTIDNTLSMAQQHSKQVSKSLNFNIQIIALYMLIF